MSGLDETVPIDRKYFLLKEGELVKTKYFLDVPDFDREELIEYIETNYDWSRFIWNIEYRVVSMLSNGCSYPIIEIVVPRWTWVKKEHRKEYGKQGHGLYMFFVKILLEYEAEKRRERRGIG